ncbi:hypothetical protein ACETRX_14685 [Labrys portucalensis]|uniref:Uncharacterized protein n=1 Tax=Labrys neptuniae TaxID=376174 RepID=A0ABV6ZFA1_9HYPH
MAGIRRDRDHIYIIGDRGVGVFLIKMSPIRIVRIPDKEVRRFGKEHNCDGYAAVAALCWRVIADHRAANGQGKPLEPENIVGIASLAEAGAELSNLEFSFGTNMSAAAIEAVRGRNRSLKMALCYLTQRTGNNLQDAVLLDDGNADDFAC